MSDLRRSLVPGTLDRLVAIARTVALPEDGWDVLDGPTRGDEGTWQYLVIGWTGLPDTRGIEFSLVDAGAGGRQKEVIDIQGQASIAVGDDGQKPVRDAVFAVVDALAAAVAADNTLGKTVTRAAFRSGAVLPDLGDGAVCTVPFTIHVEGTR